MHVVIKNPDPKSLLGLCSGRLALLRRLDERVLRDVIGVFAVTLIVRGVFHDIVDLLYHSVHYPNRTPLNQRKRTHISLFEIGRWATRELLRRFAKVRLVERDRVLARVVPVPYNFRIRLQRGEYAQLTSASALSSSPSIFS